MTDVAVERVLDALRSAGLVRDTRGTLPPTIGALTDEIGRALAEGLAWARAPWPDLENDHRGMAITSG